MHSHAIYNKLRKRNNYNNNERSNINLRKYGNVEFRVTGSISI